MESLKLHEILRYVLAGGVFLISFARASGNPNLSLSEPPFDDVALLTGLALIAGSAIYVFHRALIYPIVGRFTMFLVFRPIKYRKAHFWPYKTLPLERELDALRNKRRTTMTSAEADPDQRHLDDWGAHVHFLYCISLALLAGNFMGLYGKPIETLQWSWLIGGGVLLFLVAGLAADYRMWDFELNKVKTQKSDLFKNSRGLSKKQS